MITNEETKQIIDKIDNLLPWDKKELILHLVLDLEKEQFEEICKDLGFVNYDDIDNVQEVINNGQESDVLDEMDDQEICDYLIHTWSAYENAKYMFENIDSFDAAKMVDEMRKYDLENVLDSLIDEYHDTCKLIFEKLAENIKKWNE